MIEEQLLDPSRHDRQAFTSGVIGLDDYLKRFAVQQTKKGVTVVRVLIDTNAAHRGRGLGRFLIGCAIERCLEARKHVAAYAFLVDAKGAQAKAFYEHYGFTPCRDNPMSLYLPLGSRDQYE